MPIRNYLLIFFLSAPLYLSQTYQRELNSIPFTDPGGAVKNIFSGGINNFEFQFADIDNDGDEDILFLDSDDSYGYYSNTGTPQNPQYDLSLTQLQGFSVHNWFYLADIDNDQDFDLFTSGTDNYIRLLKNVGTAAVPFFITEADTMYDEDNNPIFTEFSSNPLFCDVDADGDKDFITGNSAGTLTFYENTGTPAQYNFKFITNEWQDIIIISTDNPHGASSLDFADIDNDGDKDLFWGDFFSKSIYFIENIGTPSVPDLEVTLRIYPPNEDSIKTSGFNMPRFTDIDGDNDLDMFISVLYDPTVPQTLMFYRNEGNNIISEFNFITSSFLPTLDAGTESIPCFIDIDNDGDKDLFLGSSKNPNGSIFYFQNTGTAVSPSFNLIDSAAGGITGELSLAPALADLDNDGDADLLVGNFDGTICYYRNEGTTADFNFIFIDTLKDESQQIIDAGLTARPFIIDIDNDSDIDLVLGGFTGEVFLFQNNGTSSVFSFKPEPLYFQSVDVGDNSTPHLIDYDNDGDLDLFTGNRTGNTFYYKNDGTNVLPIWNLITNHFTESYTGALTAPVFCDVDSDTDPDLFIGNIKGGVYFYRNMLVTGIEGYKPPIVSGLDISVFPNPFNSTINIAAEIPEHNIYQIKIYNSLGEEVFTIFNNDLLPGKYDYSWNGQNNFNYPVSSGNYIVVISSSSYSKSKNIILLK